MQPPCRLPRCWNFLAAAGKSGLDHSCSSAQTEGCDCHPSPTGHPPASHSLLSKHSPDKAASRSFSERKDVTCAVTVLLDVGRCCANMKYLRFEQFMHSFLHISGRQGIMIDVLLLTPKLRDLKFWSPARLTCLLASKAALSRCPSPSLCCSDLLLSGSEIVACLPNESAEQSESTDYKCGNEAFSMTEKVMCHTRSQRRPPLNSNATATALFIVAFKGIGSSRWLCPPLSQVSTSKASDSAYFSRQWRSPLLRKQV